MDRQASIEDGHDLVAHGARGYCGTFLQESSDGVNHEDGLAGVGVLLGNGRRLPGLSSRAPNPSRRR